MRNGAASAIENRCSARATERLQALSVYVQHSLAATNNLVLYCTSNIITKNSRTSIHYTVSMFFTFLESIATSLYHSHTISLLRSVEGQKK